MQTYVKLCKEGDEERRKAMLYDLDISRVDDRATTFVKSLVSRHTLPFYLVLFLAALALSLWSVLAN